jgi:hypothetical protein
MTRSSLVHAALALCCALAAISCSDPGCIRNSECGDGYECRRSKCVSTSPSDGGADAGKDAETHKADGGKVSADAGKK